MRATFPIRSIHLASCGLPLQDLESANKRLLASDLIVRPDDFIARTEHTRLLETALAMKQAELNREVERRLSQQERDARFALDSKETEMRKTSASHIHQVGPHSGQQLSVQSLCMRIRMRMRMDSQNTASLLAARRCIGKMHLQ